MGVEDGGVNGGDQHRTSKIIGYKKLLDTEIIKNRLAADSTAAPSSGFAFPLTSKAKAWPVAIWEKLKIIGYRNNKNYWIQK
jgi:hypothetical protein